MPQLNYSAGTPCLNLREGTFQAVAPDHHDFLDPAMSLLFFRLLQIPVGAGADIRMPAKNRDLLLETILSYYRLHVPGFREIQSHHILHTVLG